MPRARLRQRVAFAFAEEGIFRREIIGSERYLKELSRQLQQNMTLGEVLLWQRLKRKQMRGYDFDRQRPIVRVACRRQSIYRRFLLQGFEAGY
jgi:Protein of unknown function (DUF559)